jgi:hypothetical protein
VHVRGLPPLTDFEPVCSAPGSHVTLPSMLILVILTFITAGLLTLLGSIFITPEWD